MTQKATVVPLPSKTSIIEPATVTGTCDPQGFVPVSYQGESVQHARMAVHPRPVLAAGDEVLTMKDGRGAIYIVGILSCKSEVEEPSRKIQLSDGTTVRIDRSGVDESLKLYSRTNELLIDYRSRTGTMTIKAVSGDMAFSAPNGSIAFHSGKEIDLNAGHVAVNAETDLRIGVQDAGGSSGPALSMRNRKMELTAPVFDLTAQRAQLFLQETRIAGKKLLGRIGSVQFVASKIESAADTVMARARNVYRTISELSQLKAGRQRTLVEGTSHTKAQKTIMKSETDFKVKAEKIHLG
ncbi:DUF3540 domain-containing protein [uncultured Desulfosarcina sp.]|uniref:DUF3540 domain-containing protein n=1 Tax=uncultured Desulfosarcina sp. TaxID=218289 RepID=UPI0029C84275|nr:DUF3540 domain-containing protein [uncultured Desulfosarcina sp.]